MEKGIGILGGTFDPPHNGHLFLASTLSSLPFIGQLVIIPTFKPRYKDPISSYTARCCMSKATFENYRTSVFESTKSYIFEQLAELKEDVKGPLYLFVGDDWDINSWKNPDQIRKLAKVIYIRRQFSGKLYEDIKLEPFMHKDFIINLPITLDISSTKIRYMAQRGMPIEGLVHPDVALIIKTRGLYGLPKA